VQKRDVERKSTLNAEEEKRLIVQAQNGDLSAFELLYRAHAGRVHGLCARLCDSHADAQDATQETFVKAWRALDRFAHKSAFATWLHRIAFNESMSLRRRRTERGVHLKVVELESADDAATLTESGQLEDAVRNLPERAREALVLHKIYGYTHEETAEFMGTSVGASKAQVHRAMGLLRGICTGLADAAGHPSARTGK
jgi:RNA polymerase sigma-70 factor (ECF subfamily)